MKVVFFGSSEFAVESLKAILKHHSVLAVFTQPDRKKGRSLNLAQTPVKDCANLNKIDVFQPQDVNNAKTKQQLAGFNADLFIVVSFGQILSKEILEIPKKYVINVHFSLLPRWRGAAPINYAIMHDDKVTGVSVIKMNEFTDRGDMILTKSIQIDSDDDALSLSAKLSHLGAQALLEAVDLMEKDKVQFIPQDETCVTKASKLKKEDGLIDWTLAAKDIYNKVRGLLPWPCAYTYYQNKYIKILKTKLASSDFKNDREAIPGQIRRVEKKEGIVVATGSGNILIQTLQSEGKRAISAYDFVLGHHLKEGEKFDFKKA